MKRLILILTLALSACGSSQADIDAAIATGVAGTQAVRVSPLEEPKGDGVFLVGMDIAAGEWRMGSSGTTCNYWIEGDDGSYIRTPTYGLAPEDTEVYVPEWARKFVTSGCGTWTYLGP